MAHGDGPPISTLDDIIQAVHDHLSTAGYLRTGDDPSTGIEWLIGERYTGQEGAPPRVFVMVGEDGSVGAPDRVGDGLFCGGVTENCTILLWGAETTADADRYRAAKGLGVLLINCLRKVQSGRIRGLTLRRPVKTDLLTFGEEYRLTFSYFWNVPRIARVWDVPVTPVSPYDPMRPNGDTGINLTPPTLTVNGSR